MCRNHVAHSTTPFPWEVPPHFGLAETICILTSGVRTRIARKEYPIKCPRSAVLLQNVKNAKAHSHEPSPFRCFAIRHKNRPAIPIQISMRMWKSSHSFSYRMAHYGDDVG